MTLPSTTRSAPWAPLSTVYRGGIAESWHLGAVAVATPEGRLVAAAGDPELATFVRSAAKPFQILPLLLADGEQAFGLDDHDLGLVCASHGGRPEHAARAAGLLAKGGFSVDDLLCGAHPPFDKDAARELRERGEAPTALHNNCSGKHAGMLLACKLLGFPSASYVAPEHPLQRRILDHLAALAGVPVERIGVGVDGCSVPAFHLPLAAAARAYAALANPRAAGVAPEVARALSRAARAMGSAPDMVAGPGRFTTRLIAATRGRVVGKEGAEGFYGMAVLGPVALGIVFKIADGGERGRDGVALDILRQMGSLSAEEFGELEDLHRPAIRNVRGRVVGEVVSEVELQEVEVQGIELQEIQP